MIHEWTRGEYTISTDPRRLDLDLIHDFLSRRSYWAAGRSRERVVCSIEHSLPFGLYHPSGQVGFARVVTDHVVIAFLADVFVLEAHCGGGLGEWLVETVVRAPGLQRVRRWMLGTRDAHGLYRRFGFAEPAPGLLMGEGRSRRRPRLTLRGPGRWPSVGACRSRSTRPSSAGSSTTPATGRSPRRS